MENELNHPPLIDTLAPVTPDAVDKAAVIQVNFANGTITSKVEYENDGGIPKFFRDMAKFSKKNNIKSVMIITVDEEDFVDWVTIADNKHHMALAALTLEDIKEDLRDKIFEAIEIEG